MKDFEKIYSEYFDTVFQYTLSLAKTRHGQRNSLKRLSLRLSKALEVFVENVN